MNVRIVGIRHHSPACARLVREFIRIDQPDFVLIEGPSDFNPRLQELHLDHSPPLAIFSYYQSGGHYHRSFCPFCSYSPEWLALQTANEVGSRCLFVDLPSWTRPFREVENRYHDEDRSRDYVAQLCERLNLSGMDDLWDHLFEQPCPLPQLQERLTTYFANLRACSQANPSDEEREEFMARYIAWAAKQGSVLVVCGGFHQPALERLWPKASSSEPQAPEPEEEGRFGSFLVPYSYPRLDSFTGYAAGMPSPEYYRILWEEGAQRAQTQALETLVARLRERKVEVSAADLIACRAMTDGLARLRAHEVPSRADLLDGLAAGLIKHGLSAELPWTRRAPLTPDTDLVLAEMMKALRGNRKGTLHPETPLPPLVASAEKELREAELFPDKSRTANVHTDTSHSYLLHRLRILEIPGFKLEQQQLGEETWKLVRNLNFLPALIEAGAYGATLEEATLAKLEDRLQRSELNTREIAKLVGEAYLAGLGRLTGRLLSLLQHQCSSETDLAAIGYATAVLLNLWRNLPQTAIRKLLQTLVERCFWLVELATGPNGAANPDEIKAFAALRDCVRLLEMDPTPLLDLMARRSREPSAPSCHRGAAVGILWGFESNHSLLDMSLESLHACSHPSRLGDYLAGLFGLAREEVAAERELVAAIDILLKGYTEQEFLVALPALRGAFSFFPPREREQIAGLVLTLYGHSPQQSWTLVAECSDPESIAENRLREQQVEELLERYGLNCHAGGSSQ